MKNELITVIVPCYNVQNYIERTVDSILSQSYENIEVILVDDGSKDDTATVLDELKNKDSRIAVYHKENGGVTSARLWGVKNAKGSYILFCDGDDTQDSEMVETLYDNAVEYNADISHCGYKMAFPSRTDYYYNTGEVIVQDNIKGINDLLNGEKIEPGLCNKLYKKELFDYIIDDTSIMDWSVKINEDLLMNYCLFKKADKSVFEDKCLYNYMVRENSAATSGNKECHISDPVNVRRIIFEDVKDNPDLINSALKCYVTALISNAGNYSTFKKEMVSKYRNKAKKEIKALLSTILKSCCGNSIKLKSVWVCYFSYLYYLVHKVYAKLNGNDKKYDIS